MGSIIHTANPRLAPDDIAWIIRDAGSVVLFAELSFVGLLETIAPLIPDVRAIVLLADRSEMPELTLAPGQELLCYEEILAATNDDFAWPVLDENLASGLCYTSGTTGKPKGVLYTHRSTLIHAYALNAADVFGLRSIDRVLPIVPMFHVNAWGLPYSVPLAGASFVMPGRHLDGPSVADLMNRERVTFSAGVPTVWMGLLAHLQKTGERLTTLKRLVTGGSACPPSLAEAFERDYGVNVIHAWGMTETSPLGTIFAPLPGFEALTAPEQRALMLKQGRPVPGLQIRIVDDQGTELPWDGQTFGNLEVRGPWVLQRYFNGPTDAANEAGWFATGDVATIDADGYLEITDRTKDVVKSGGEWISSIQLENIAVSHPDVAEAAVVAARHPRWDERPLLIVVAKPDRTIDPAELLAMYEGQVAKWWIPDEVVVVDELPHTATGKLNKLALRQQFRGFQLASVTA